jgi:uncharacterized membrane protein
MSFRKALTFVLTALIVCYPVVVYTGMEVLGMKGLCGILLGTALLRALVTRSSLWWVIAAAVAILSAFSLTQQDPRILKLYPVAINAVLFVVFAWSLRFPPSVAERLARLETPDLPPHAVRYTARVTQVWCVFFVFNGAIALITVYWASAEIWALYNGVVSYVLMATLMGAEWLVRCRVKSQQPAEAPSGVSP